MKITTKSLKDFREDFKDAVKDLEKHYMVTINFGAITYSNEDFSVKIKVFNSEDGKNADQVQFEKYAESYGLKKSDYGRTYPSHRGTCKLVTIKPKNTKYPIVVERGGRRYKVPMDLIEIQQKYWK